MKAALPIVRRLRRDQFLRFEHPCGLRLRAEQGALWVTVDGEPEDITIEAGDSHVFAGDTPVLVGTFRSDAVLSAAESRCAPTWRNWFGLAAPRMVEAA